MALDELLLNISIEGVGVSAKISVHESHLIDEKNNLLANYRNYTESEKKKGVIFTCAGFSIA